jgi:tetratricopeptide (TPR) repeat protein
MTSLADLPAVSHRPTKGDDAIAELPALKNGSPVRPTEEVPDLTDMLEFQRLSDKVPFEPAPIVDLPVAKDTIDLPAMARAKQTPDQSEELVDHPKSKGDLPSAISIKQGARESAVTDSFGELELPVLKQTERRASGHFEAPLLDESELPAIKAVPPPPPPHPHQRTVKEVAPPIKPAIGPSNTVVGPQAKPPIAKGDSGAAALPPSRLSDRGTADFMDLDVDLPVLSTPRVSTETPAVGEELDLNERASDTTEALNARSNRSESGTASYGEMDLASGAGASTTSEMEFGFTQEPLELEEEPSSALAPEILRRQRGAEFEAKQEAQSKKSLRVAIKWGSLVVVMALAGLALGQTEYGMFGIYSLEQYLPSAADPAFASAAIKKAEKLASTDTYSDVRRSLKSLAEARHRAGLNRAVLAASLLHESLYLARFGRDSASSARAAAIVARLEERGGKAPGMALARAADTLQRGELDAAEKHLQTARRLSPSDAYLELVAGELALRRENFDAADKAFSRSLALGGAARAQWGLARTARERARPKQVAILVEATLAISPFHADALVEKAALLIKQYQEIAAQALLRRAVGLDPIEGRYLWISKKTAAAGFTMLGYLDELHGRLRSANRYYNLALDADPFRGEALVGSGRVSLTEHRYSDALARFESALNLSKTDTALLLTGRVTGAEAELGIGQALLSLDKIRDGQNRLKVLADRFPNDSEIALWLGKAQQANRDLDSAKQQYRKAIELGPDRFEGYLALAQLLFKEGKEEQASAILNDATRKVPESAEMRRMLGQSELARNHLDNAVHEFKRAIELDPEDWEARFGLGVAQRRLGNLEEARQIFQQVAVRDPSHGGLALEQGLIFEAQGKYKKAVETYQAALKTDPKNIDLLLRLGAAQVEAGAIADAQHTLEKVIAVVPNSAEAEHFMGRIALAQGRAPEALIHLDRAINLDNTRAEFHLYAGLAALEMANLGRTYQEAQAALAIDSNMGDPYWLRGLVRLRTGAVKDALEDLETAVRLKPSRYDAYAAMGDCYEQMRNLPAAVLFYRKALDNDAKNGQWWYRLGSLQLDLGSRREAIDALERATMVSDNTVPPPTWLAEAHRLAGEAFSANGDRKTAIVHYQRYLRLASKSALDRDAVVAVLQRWGVEVK